MSTPPKTVIVATHDASVSDRFKAALRAAGHRALNVRSREDLLHRLRSPALMADLLLLDLQLGSGTEGVRQVRALRAGIPIVMFSGSVPDAATVRTLAQLGVDSYVNDHCPIHQVLPALAPCLFADSFNRRTSPRVTLGLSVAYRFGDAIATAPVLNLSKGGLGVRTMTPLAAGRKVRARFRLPGSRQDIDAEARVAWSDQRTGMGLQFEEVQTTDQSTMDEFIDHQIFDSDTR